MADSQLDVKKLAKLSRLHFTDEEESGVKSKLESVIAMVAKVMEADTTGIQPSTSVIAGAKTPERPDAVTESNNRDAHQRNAPKAEMGFYVVPKVVE